MTKSQASADQTVHIPDSQPSADLTVRLPEMLTTGDIANILRTPESTVRYWRHIGTGPQGVRVGRRVLYRREAVAAWLAQREAAENEAR